MTEPRPVIPTSPLTTGSHGGPDVLDDRRAGAVDGRVGRQDIDDRGVADGGAHGGQLDTFDAARRVGCRLSVGGRDEDLDGREDSRAHTALGQGLQRVIPRTAARQGLDA